MNEEIRTQLATLIEKLLSGIDTTTEWGSVVIPETIMQLLMWNFWSSIAIAVIYALIVTTNATFLYRTIRAYLALDASERRKHWLVDDDRDPTGLVGWSFVSGIVSVFMIVFAFSHMFTALKIALAPNVWLLEYSSKLVN